MLTAAAARLLVHVRCSYHATCVFLHCTINVLPRVQDIRDLLSRDPDGKLELKEHPESGVYVKDLTTYVVKSVAEIDAVLQVSRWRCCAVCDAALRRRKRITFLPPPHYALASLP